MDELSREAQDLQAEMDAKQTLWLNVLGNTVRVDADVARAIFTTAIEELDKGHKHFFLAAIKEGEMTTWRCYGYDSYAEVLALNNMELVDRPDLSQEIITHYRKRKQDALP